MRKVAVLVQDGAEPFGLGVDVRGVGRALPPRGRQPGLRLRGLHPEPRPGAAAVRLRPVRRARPRGDGRTPTWSAWRPSRLPRPRPRGARGACARRTTAARSSSPTAPPPSCSVRPACSTAASAPPTGATPTGWRSCTPRRWSCPDVLYCQDGTIVTGAGSAAGIDASLHLMRQQFGARCGRDAARRMVVPPHRSGGQAQFIARAVPDCDAETLGPLLTWIIENLGDDLSSRAGAAQPHVAAHVRPPVPRRDRHHPAQLGDRAAGAGGRGDARADRPPRRLDRERGRFRQRRRAAPPLLPRPRGQPAAVPPYVHRRARS